MAIAKTLYIMVPGDLPQDMIIDMLEMRSDLTLFDEVKAGREAVSEAGNDPDEGYIVGVTFEILDANGHSTDGEKA